MSTKNEKLIVILGPTASGKTDLAIKLAKRFGGEIVCADSRQIYSEMAIGTASPFLQSLRGTVPRKLYGRQSPVKKPLALQGISHHLFHIVSPKRKFNVALYKKLAEKTIKDIQKRGKIPFLVGGSSFYIYSVVAGWQFPEMKTNQKLRNELEKKSLTKLIAILKQLDPERASSIETKNKRRLIRAIEIARALGKVPKLEKKPQFDCLLLGFKSKKEQLKQKISQRVERMLVDGLEKEVKKLAQKYGFQAPALASVGYQEWQAYFQPSLNSCDRKNCEMEKFKKDKDKEELIKEIAASIKLNTWRLVKRQMTWFKRDERISWVKNYQEAKRAVMNFLE